MISLRVSIFVLAAFTITIVSGSSSIPDWTNLRVTFGFNPATSFDAMPRTARTAVASGWHGLNITDCQNGGKFNGNRYIYGDDVSMSLLFDKNGIIAGIQMNLIKKEILSPNNLYRFDKVRMYQTDVIEGIEVFTLTAYFVEPSSICTTGRSNQHLERGTGSMLKFQNGPSPNDIIDVPLKRSDAIQEGWSKNNCFYGMGYHNFYKSEEFENTNCQEIRPAFLLFSSSGDLHGFGFASPGYATSSRFEHPSSGALKRIIGKDVAQCMLDSAETLKYSSMHVYFIERPYLINCWF